MVCCPYKRKERDMWDPQRTHRESHVKMEADIRVTHLQAKGCHGLAEPPGTGREGFFLGSNMPNSDLDFGLLAARAGIR